MADVVDHSQSKEEALKTFLNNAFQKMKEIVVKVIQVQEMFDIQTKLCDMGLEDLVIGLYSVVITAGSAALGAPIPAPAAHAMAVAAVRSSEGAKKSIRELANSSEYADKGDVIKLLEIFRYGTGMDSSFEYMTKNLSDDDKENLIKVCEQLCKGGDPDMQQLLGVLGKLDPNKVQGVQLQQPEHTFLTSFTQQNSKPEQQPHKPHSASGPRTDKPHPK